MTRAMTEEMTRLIVADGYNVHLHEGYIRLRYARKAWAYISQRLEHDDPITAADVREVGYLLEPVKNFTLRKVTRSGACAPEQLDDALKVWATLANAAHTSARIAYVMMQFIRFDPFVEGTARVACLLQHWLQIRHETHRATHPKAES